MTATRNKTKNSTTRAARASMATARAAPPAPPAPLDTYFALVRQFPLRPIRDDAHCDEAEAMIGLLLRRHLDAGEQDYLDALTLLVGAYEDETCPMPAVPVADMLRELMRANGYSQTRLAKETGIAQPTISAILSGEREIAKDHMVRLGKVFGLPAGAFLGEE